MSSTAGRRGRRTAEPGESGREARRGQVNQRIAHDLVVALDTVKKHVSHGLGKLGAANRTEAAARARHLGLIPRHRPQPARQHLRVTGHRTATFHQAGTFG